MVAYAFGTIQFGSCKVDLTIIIIEEYSGCVRAQAITVFIRSAYVGVMVQLQIAISGQCPCKLVRLICK